MHNKIHKMRKIESCTGVLSTQQVTTTYLQHNKQCHMKVLLNSFHLNGPHTGQSFDNSLSFMEIYISFWHFPLKGKSEYSLN